MRAPSAALIAILAVLAPLAHAQQGSPYPPDSLAEPAPPPPIAPPDMVNYCVYENKIYSLGAGLCIGRTAYVCVPSPAPATGNRAYWTNKPDQVFPLPGCG